MTKIHAVAIDFQNSFTSPKGELYVQDGEKAADNFANFLIKHASRIEDVHATLDSHQRFHIAHPKFWRTKDGKEPSPFTLITLKDFENGTYRPVLPSLDKIAKNYITQLEKNNRYQLMIWPIHCVIGTWGHNIYDSVNNAFSYWCDKNYGTIDYVTKGSNAMTEHYSCLLADVPDPNDDSTQVNVGLLNTLKEADIVLFTGLAESHCLRNSITDIANYFNDDSLIKKMVLLEDCTKRVTSPDSNVDAFFQKMVDDFRKEMTARGMRISTTKDFF